MAWYIVLAALLVIGAGLAVFGIVILKKRKLNS
jgi:hypothetical protein